MVELRPHKPYGAGSNPVPATRSARLGDVRGYIPRARADRWKVSERSRAALAKRVVRPDRGSNPRPSALWSAARRSHGEEARQYVGSRPSRHRRPQVLPDMEDSAEWSATGVEYRATVTREGSSPLSSAQWRQRRVSRPACKAGAFGMVGSSPTASTKRLRFQHTTNGALVSTRSREPV